KDSPAPNLEVFAEIRILGVELALTSAMAYGLVLMTLGGAIITAGWITLYQNKDREFADTGLYRISRHPQYAGFILLVIGWMIGWPTILTLILGPMIIYKYADAGRKEEQQFKQNPAYLGYAEKTPFLV
ncbi:MAG: DUF1295 domain-containing protein, partial [Candidatus Altiarchaeales archaeon]|nr:DUF1295 domain-containing protein [Candidatus Altiarchaeales archaeon]